MDDLPTLPPYSFAVTIGEADIDRLKHVNNVAWLGMIQDAAIRHWLTVSTDDVRQAFYWVVRRHEIDYHKPGFLNDELTVKTWVGTPTAATWERFTEISRPADGSLLVASRTVWVLIDAQNHRPKRIDARITGCFRPAG